ncbi:MAG: hypothetical protein GX802_02195, partial [Clostridiales bacterium]|nr:hypothetical protein [Clostridiales bacterium]
MQTALLKIKAFSQGIFRIIKDFVLRIVKYIKNISREIWCKFTKQSATDDAADSTKCFDRSMLPIQEDKQMETQVKAPNKQKEPRPSTMFKKNDLPRSLALSILFTTIKVLAVIVILVGAAGMGLVLGVAKAYIDTTPMLDISAFTSSSRNSYIYDTNGEIITTFAGMQYREWANIDEIPDMLKNAVVAIEDVRFYKHEGVDYKRLVSAVVNTFRNQDTHGGSTIT